MRIWDADTIVLAQNGTYAPTKANNTSDGGANALPVITSKDLTIQGNDATITPGYIMGSGSFPDARLLDVAPAAKLRREEGAHSRSGSRNR